MILLQAYYANEEFKSRIGTFRDTKLLKEIRKYIEVNTDGSVPFTDIEIKIINPVYGNMSPLNPNYVNFDGILNDYQQHYTNFENILEANDEHLDTLMSDFESDDTNFEISMLHRDYWNSPFRYADVPITLREFIEYANARNKKIIEHLEDVVKNGYSYAYIDANSAIPILQLILRDGIQIRDFDALYSRSNYMEQLTLMQVAMSYYSSMGNLPNELEEKYTSYFTKWIVESIMDDFSRNI